MSTVFPRGSAWRMAGVTVTALLLLTFVLYRQTIVYLTGIWNQLVVGNYAHGYLVLLISLYLIYINRQRLKVLSPCPEYRALPAVMLASLFWMTAAIVDVEVLQTASLLLLVLTIVWTMLGTRVTRILAFPVLFVSFAIPVWFPLSPILQDLTADVVFWLIRLLEIPAMREENVIVVPAGRLLIEEACSGLRYFLAALTLGTLYAYQNYESLRSRVTVVLVSAGAALLANILRVFIVVYLGYKTDMQHPLVQDHLTLGWYLFGGVVAILLFVDNRLHRAGMSGESAKPAGTIIESVHCNNSVLQYAVAGLLTATLISSGPVIVHRMSVVPQTDKLLQFELPVTSRWSATELAEDGWEPNYPGAIVQKKAFLDESNREVVLFLGVYASQRQGEELINDLNYISDNKVWRIRYQRAKLHEAAGHNVLEQLLEREDGTRRLVWYWYRVAGQNTTNKYQAKALQVLGMLKNTRTASVIAVATRLDDDAEDTRKILSRFISDMALPLERVADGKN